MSENVNTRDALFPPSNAPYAFGNPLKFNRTFAQAGGDVEALWALTYGNHVRFEARDVQSLAFGQCMFFAYGGKDHWAVWIGRFEDNGEMYVALSEDKYYFEIMHRLALAYGGRKVFADVVALYYAMAYQKSVHDEVVVKIREMASKYPGYDNKCWAYNMLMHMYYGMLAEENDNVAVMGRRMKVYAAGRILLYGDPVDSVACCAVGKSYRDVDEEVRSWGLVADD